MPVLSIIACGMLEDELVHVLSEDSELGQLILVENRECFGLKRKLKNRNCSPALSPLDRIPEFLKSEKDLLLLAILKPFCGFKCVEKIHKKLQIHDKNHPLPCSERYCSIACLVEYQVFPNLAASRTPCLALRLRYSWE